MVNNEKIRPYQNNR